MRPPEFPPDNPITKGDHRKRQAMIKPNLQYYLIFSPKNQVRQSGGHAPYIKGMRTADPKIKSELNRCYGRLGKSFNYHFLLTTFDNKGGILWILTI